LVPASELKREEGGGQHAPLHDASFLLLRGLGRAYPEPGGPQRSLGGLAESMGGRLLSFYNSFGEYDVLVIYEAPDESTAAAIVLAAISPGHLSAVKTTVLLSAEEGVEAMRKAGEAAYRGPGPQ
jgi:uncharacterized protein with GYD domain